MSGLQICRKNSQNGEAVNVRVFRHSGDNWLDRQAVRSIVRLANIPDIPSATRETRTVQANIIAARDKDTFHALRDELLIVEQARIASEGPDSKVIAINSGTQPTG